MPTSPCINLSNPPFLLGRITIDPKARTITCDGKAHHCEPKVFDLLIYFCRKNSEIITKEMLLAEVWQDRMVTDNAINRKIYQLRKLLNALDDSADYLETMPKFGYRLTQPVQINEHLAETSSTFKVKRNSHRIRWSLASLIFVLLLSVCLWFTVYPSAPAIPNGDMTLKLLTSLNGVQSDASLSPDSRSLLFSYSKKPLHAQLILQKLAEHGSTPLTSGQHQDVGGQWHPNGKQIAFVRLSDNVDASCGIYRLMINDKLNNVPQKIVTCSGAGLPTLAWGEQPEQLYFTDRSGVDEPYILYSVNVNNRVKSQLTQPALSHNRRGDHFVQRNPSGSKLLLLSFLDKQKVSVSVYQSKPFVKRYQFEINQPIASIGWSADEHWFYFTQSKQLYRVDNSGLNPLPIYGLDVYASGLQVSADNSQLTFTSHAVDSDIWRYDAGKWKSFIGSTKMEKLPRYARHNDHIVFVSDRSGNNQFWLHSDKGEVHQLSDFSFDLNINHYDWSGDENQLLFEQHGTIYSYEIASGKLTPWIDEAQQASIANWSSDGKSFYYGVKTTDSWQIWRFDLATKHTEQLTFNGGYSALDNPQDGHLYYCKYQQDGLFRLNPDGSESLILADFSPLNGRTWRIINNQVHYAKPTGAIYRYDLSDQTDTQIMAFDLGTMDDYSISNDGTQLSYTKLIAHKGDVFALQFGQQN